MNKYLFIKDFLFYLFWTKKKLLWVHTTRLYNGIEKYSTFENEMSLLKFQQPYKISIFFPMNVRRRPLPINNFHLNSQNIMFIWFSNQSLVRKWMKNVEKKSVAISFSSPRKTHNLINWLFFSFSIPFSMAHAHTYTFHRSTLLFSSFFDSRDVLYV